MSEKRPYLVKRIAEPVPLSGEVEGTPWAQTPGVSVDLYPWYQSGDKQPTTARMLYDTTTLYLQFLCEDKHIFSETTELNGPVCRDSCVEFFAMPNQMRRQEYFNLEINACGTLLLGWGVKGDRRRISQEMASRLTIVTSVPEPTKDESPDDNGWWVAAAVPFDLLSEFTERTIQPGSGGEWYVNFYRCGGRTDDQYACWWPIETPTPDFHRPEFFGQILFA